MVASIFNIYFTIANGIWDNIYSMQICFEAGAVRIRVFNISYFLSPTDKKSFTLFVCLRSLDLNSFKVELLQMSISYSFHNLKVDGMNEVSYDHKREKGTSKFSQLLKF